jgi:hypothetical protein
MRCIIKADLNDWGKRLLKEDYATVIRDFKENETFTRETLIEILRKEVPIDLFRKETICTEWVDTDLKVDDVVRVFLPDCTVMSHITIIDSGLIGVSPEPFRRLVKSGDIKQEDVLDRIKGKTNDISFDAETCLDKSQNRKNKWKISRVSPQEALSYWSAKKEGRAIEKILMLSVVAYKELLNNGYCTGVADIFNGLKQRGIWYELENFFNDKNLLHGKYRDCFDKLDTISLDEFNDELRAYYGD